MLGLRTDLPLDRDAAARFLPWILGFMVYLAALAVGAALIVDRLADLRRREIRRREEA